MTTFDIADCAARLLEARRTGNPTTLHPPPDRAAAFAVQDACLRVLGPVGGWKLGADWEWGAAAPTRDIRCAPLPASGMLQTGTRAVGGTMRGVEVEIAFRLRKDLPCPDGVPGRAQLLDAIDAVVPVIELVETRLAGWRTSPSLAQLADLSSHGGLVIGEPSCVSPSDIDMRHVEGRVLVDGQPLPAYVDFYGTPLATTRGSNLSKELWRGMGWLADHCARRGFPWQAGQLVTTGSCTGLFFAPAGARIRGELLGIGSVDLQF